MTMFCELSPFHQAVLLIVMFITMLTALLCIGLSRYIKHSLVYIPVDAVIFLALFIFIAQFCEAEDPADIQALSKGLLGAPAFPVWCITVCSAVWLAFQAFRGLRGINRTIGRHSVKEAMDTLPSAICYFTPGESVKLCNIQMHKLFHTLSHSDLQTLSELHTALERCDENSEVIRLPNEKQTYIFPDGRVWRYSEAEITAADGVTYTEVMLCDVSELYKKHLELKRRNAELKEMYRDIKRLSDNVLKMTRESEILTAKTVLHDRMGAGIVAIRQSLRQNHTSSENAEAIGLLCNAVKAIKDDNDYPVGRSDVEEFLHDASVVGIKAEINGEMPDNEIIRSLFLLAMKECFTNAVSHAGAEKITINTEKSGDVFSIAITNDGKPPEATIVPSGGLLNLSRHVADCGGKMDIQSEPYFCLTVKVPADNRNNKQEVLL